MHDARVPHHPGTHVRRILVGLFEFVRELRGRGGEWTIREATGPVRSLRVRVRRRVAALIYLFVYLFI